MLNLYCGSCINVYNRRSVILVVTYIRNAELSDILKITSSRQSPIISAWTEGLDLVPLFELHPEADRRVPPLYFEILVPSSNSLKSSLSHQITWFDDEGTLPAYSFVLER